MKLFIRFREYNHNKSKYFSLSGGEQEDTVVPTMADTVPPCSFQCYYIWHSRIELGPLHIIFIHQISFKQGLIVHSSWALSSMACRNERRMMLWQEFALMKLSNAKRFLMTAPSIMSTSNAQQAFCLPSAQCVVCTKILPLICGYNSLY